MPTLHRSPTRRLLPGLHRSSKASDTPRLLLTLVAITSLTALGLLAVALRLGLPVAPLPATPLPSPPDTSLSTLSPPLHGFVSRGLEPSIGHFGVDVAVPSGTAVHAAAAGRVALADSTQEGGLTLVLLHPSGLTTIYKHNERLLTRMGQTVAQGQIIALSGSTGRLTTGPHLHFEAWRGGQPLDVRALVEETGLVR